MTSPVSIPAGHELLASDFDAYENATASWTDFAPSVQWTASTTNPVLGNGTIAAEYRQVGKTVTYNGVINMGSTTTYGTGDWRINLPVAAAGGGKDVGVATLIDSSAQTNSRPGSSELVTTSTLRFLSTTGRVDATNPFVWATGDALRWAITYEVA